jgi:hypothetical protein
MEISFFSFEKDDFLGFFFTSSEFFVCSATHMPGSAAKESTSRHPFLATGLWNQKLLFIFYFHLLCCDNGTSTQFIGSGFSESGSGSRLLLL